MWLYATRWEMWQCYSLLGEFVTRTTGLRFPTLYVGRASTDRMFEY